MIEDLYNKEVSSTVLKAHSKYGTIFRNLNKEYFDSVIQTICPSILASSPSSSSPTNTNQIEEEVIMNNSQNEQRLDMKKSEENMKKVKKEGEGNEGNESVKQHVQRVMIVFLLKFGRQLKNKLV